MLILFDLYKLYVPFLTNSYGRNNIFRIITTKRVVERLSGKENQKKMNYKMI